MAIQFGKFSGSLINQHSTIHDYIYDIPETDYLASILKRKAYTIHNIIPQDFFHITHRDLFYLLHKLRIRPPL